MAHGIDRAALRERLDRLRALGLVRGKSGAVVSNPPERALGRLIDLETEAHQEAVGALESVRALLPELAAEHAGLAVARGVQAGVELVDGGDVVALLRSLAAASTGEVLWLRPDMWQHPYGAGLNSLVADLVGAGRRSRAIYPARVLEEAPEVLRARAQMGEQVRVLATVPSRLAILGGFAALLPERWGVHDQRRVIVRQESMVSAATLLFECLWDRAVAVPGMTGQGKAAGLISARRLVLDQLVSGAKDEEIARALGLSLRTVRRRIAEILEELGAGSRFEAGVEAVRRGIV